MLKGITLTVESGLQRGTEFHIIAPSICTVGRTSDCDVAILGDPDPYAVSRRHCRLDVTAFGVKIRDLGSRNGTFVNGKLIGKRPDSETDDFDFWVSEGRRLLDGDVISFGGVNIRVAVEIEQPVFLSTTDEAAMIADMVSMGA